MEYYLMHHGVKGQHWGVRRYQNEDGSLTEAGRQHYGVKSHHEPAEPKRPEAKDIVALRKQYAENQSDLVRFAKTTVATTSAKNTYDTYRALGKGRINSALRALFNVSFGQMGSYLGGAVGRTANAALKIDNDSLIGKALIAASRWTGDWAATKAADAANVSGSVQEALAKKELYKQRMKGRG